MILKIFYSFKNFVVQSTVLNKFALGLWSLLGADIKPLILVEAGTGIEPVYADLQSAA